MRAKTSGAKAFIGCRASCPTFESIASDVGVKTVFEISQDGERTKAGRIDLLTELQNIPRGSRAPKRQQVRVPLWWRRRRFADAARRRATTWHSSTCVVRECLLLRAAVHLGHDRAGAQTCAGLL